MLRKKGFTLIEIMVVVIIVGILAALATGNYGKLVEKGRGAEARKILGMIRNQQAAYYFENNKYTSDLTELQMGDLPTSGGTGNSRYFFKYSTTAGTTLYNVTAIRCTAEETGKSPGWVEAYTINLTTNGTWAYNNSNYV